MARLQMPEGAQGGGNLIRPRLDSAELSRIVYPYFASRMCGVIALQMQSVAVGWDVYAATHRPLDLGFVGLAQFAPALLLSLVAGHTADRFDRKRILAVCYVGIGLLAAGLFFLEPTAGVAPLYALLVLLGCARAFAAPAGQAFLPDLVPKEELARVVAQGSSVFQVGLVIGPALGGVAYGAIGRRTYLVCAVLALAAAVLVSLIRAPRAKRAPPSARAAALFAGVRYVRENKVVLGAISLDLFAVLLSGAVALLPIFARDILMAGPWGLGALRSAPAIGAALTGLALARFPIRRSAGKVMLVCVAIFGLATILFGLSRSLALSLVALAVTGAADMVSMVVRGTLVQLATPEEMRGRVSAVNAVFIGASNELGELESGLTAAWLGVVPSVVLGGVGTIVVTAIWALAFRDLARVDRLE
jgi:MFS family permease